MDHLDKLEAKSIYIIREAYSCFKSLCMLWSIGKDSTVLLCLARKAFYGHVPFPLVHIDTHYKIPEMIKYRDDLAMKWDLDMIYGENKEALDKKLTFPDGNCTHLECCKNLKTEALQHTLMGDWPRYRLNHDTGKYEADLNNEPYTGVIVGVRADEEGSRSKERYFSPRDVNNDWDIGDQPPEFWGQFKTDFAPGTHLRIHPLLDWTELDIWEYIRRESVPVVSLYFDKGEGKRYRSLGCWPCTKCVESTAKDLDDIVEELKTGK
ncbi:MAG: sulfate adenylyltransferase subunit CysD, partial [Clostridia bacterium]